MNNLKRIGIIGLAFVTMLGMMGAGSLTAQGQTTADLQAQIASLLAQIQQLQAQLGTNVTTGAYNFTRSLTIGAQGADVTALQSYLISEGYSIPAGATGYFGVQTQGATAAWQATNGVSPAVGYFGPISQARYNSLTAVVTTPVVDDEDEDVVVDEDDSSDTSTSLWGTVGTIESTELVSTLSNEEVGEGANDVEVAGLRVEAGDESDIEITALKLVFAYTGLEDDDLDDYASEVSVWYMGEKVAELDASEFNDDNTYSKYVSLNSGVVIEAGEEEDIIVAVSGANNLDSGNVGESWSVNFTDIRYRDGSGATIAESVTEDAVDFSFESFASSANLKFDITKGDEDINDARSIQVSSTTDTDNVDILSFEIEVEGNSDVDIDDIPVNFTAVNAGVGQIINTAKLVVNGDVIASESVTSATTTSVTVTFDNINWGINSGSTVEVIVRVDINDLDSNFTAGDTLSADVDPSDAGWDIEDEKGDDVAAGDKSGSAASDAHVFYADGIHVSLIDTSATANPFDGDDNDSITLITKFSVKAYGATAWIVNANTLVATSTTATTTAPGNTEGVGFALQSSDAASIATSSVSSLLSSASATEGTYAFKVLKGETETFTLTVTVTNSATDTLDAAYIRSILTGIGFGNTDLGTADHVYTASIADDFKTDYGYITN